MTHAEHSDHSCSKDGIGNESHDPRCERVAPAARPPTNQDAGEELLTCSIGMPAALVTNECETLGTQAQAALDASAGALSIMIVGAVIAALIGGVSALWMLPVARAVLRANAATGTPGQREFFHALQHLQGIGLLEWTPAMFVLWPAFALQMMIALRWGHRALGPYGYMDADDWRQVIAAASIISYVGVLVTAGAIASKCERDTAHRRSPPACAVMAVCRFTDDYTQG